MRLLRSTTREGLPLQHISWLVWLFLLFAVAFVLLAFWGILEASRPVQL